MKPIRVLTIRRITYNRGNIDSAINAARKTSEIMYIYALHGGYIVSPHKPGAYTQAYIRIAPDSETMHEYDYETERWTITTLDD